MNLSQVPIESPLASLLTEQRQLEPSLPTLTLASELLSDVSQKLKDLRDDLHSRSQLELDENLLFLDISKEVLRVQSLLIFLSQGKPLLRDKKEEILVNLGSKGRTETQRVEEDQEKLGQHQEIIAEYKKQLHSLKKQNKELKRIAKLYLASEERRVRSPEKGRDQGGAGEKTVERKKPRIVEKPKSSGKKAIGIRVPEQRFEMPGLRAGAQENKRKTHARRLMFGSMEKPGGWTDNSKVKLRLESEIQGLDDEIEQLTRQINQYL